MFESIRAFVTGKSAEQRALEEKINAKVDIAMKTGAALRENANSKAQAQATLKDALESAVTAQNQNDQHALDLATETIGHAVDTGRRANTNEIKIIRAKQDASQNFADESTEQALHAATTLAGTRKDISVRTKRQAEIQQAKEKDRAIRDAMDTMAEEQKGDRIGSGGISAHEINGLINAHREIKEQQEDSRLDAALRRVNGVEQSVKQKQD